MPMGENLIRIIVFCALISFGLSLCPTITSAVTWTASVNCSNIAVEDTGTLTIKGSTPLLFCTSSIRINGVLNVTGARHVFSASMNITFGSGSKVYFEEVVFSAGSIIISSSTMKGISTKGTIGTPNVCAGNYACGGGGAAHRTAGGIGSENIMPYSGGVYDTSNSQQHLQAGSKGGYGLLVNADNYYEGGLGGGYIMFYSAGVFTASGLNVDVSGQTGPTYGNTFGGGGGSGGSIVVTAQVIVCTGSNFNANGGNAPDVDYAGGGGAGGVIELHSVNVVSGPSYYITGGHTAGAAGAQDGGTGSYVVNSVQESWSAGCAAGSGSSGGSVVTDSATTTTTTTSSSSTTSSTAATTSTSTTTGASSFTSTSLSSTTDTTQGTAPTSSTGTTAVSSTSPSSSSSSSTSDGTSATTAPADPSAIITNPPPANSAPSTGLVAAIAVLVALFVIGVALMIVYIMRERRSKQQKGSSATDGKNFKKSESTVALRKEDPSFAFAADSTEQSTNNALYGMDLPSSMMNSTASSTTSAASSRPGSTLNGSTVIGGSSVYGESMAGMDGSQRVGEKSITYKFALAQTHRATQVQELIADRGTKLLGSGLTADVYRVKYNREHVAIKKFKHTHPAALAEFHQEVAILTRFGEERHPNVVCLHFICSEADNYAIVMDLVEGGSVAQCVSGDIRTDAAMRRRLGCEITAGMVFLHSKGIAHRDLKPSNVLMEGKGGSVKIADFGASRVFDGDDSITVDASVACTPHYSAPEIFREGQRIHLMPTDVYSFGVVLWSLLAQRVPFSGENVDTVVSRVRNSTNEQLFPKVWQGEDDIYALIVRCTGEASQRPKFSAVQQELSAVRRSKLAKGGN